MCHNPCFFVGLCYTCVKTVEAVDHDKQGTSPIGLYQLVAASDAMCPPMDIPVNVNGEKPSLSAQWHNATLSRTKHTPITKRSETFNKFDPN